MTKDGLLRPLRSSTKPSYPAQGVSSTPRPLDSITGVSGILDRPPSRVMTTEAGDDDRKCGVLVFITHDSAFPRRDAPEWCMSLPPNRGRGECRVPNAPAASSLQPSLRGAKRRSNPE